MFNEARTLVTKPADFVLNNESITGPIVTPLELGVGDTDRPFPFTSRGGSVTFAYRFVNGTDATLIILPPGIPLDVHASQLLKG